MADKVVSASSSSAKQPIWMKQAEEAKLKSEAEKTAAAKAAFEATFKAQKEAAAAANNNSSDSELDDDESVKLKDKPVGPVCPSRCIASGTGIAGGTACSPSSFIVTANDSDGRRLTVGGSSVKVRVSPGVGVGGADAEGAVKDAGDGTYTVTYVVPKRGNYMVHVELDGTPIMGSPFPVFFSAGVPVSTAGILSSFPSASAVTSPYPNLVNHAMPNMPNYSGIVSGAFPGLLGMIPGAINGASGGMILPGMGATLGEVCREYVGGRCVKGDCKLNHPPHNLLMAALAASTTMNSLGHLPMSSPSAAAVAAAQAIVAAQALQAHAAQAQAQVSASVSESSNKDTKSDALKRTVQVSNLSPLLTADHLKQLFGYCGTVVECNITDSKHFAYIEYSKPEEATAALALNNMDIGGRPLNVEMAKSLPVKPLNSSMQQNSLPVMMQQAVAMQQMQFQQALLMQQTMAAQQAANKAATVKSATELASARAAEISKLLKIDGIMNEDEDNAAENKNLRLDSSPMQKSKSRSRSPVKHGSHRSGSRSPVIRNPKRRSPTYSPSNKRFGRRFSPRWRNRRRSRSISPYKHVRRRSRSLSPSNRRRRDHMSRSPDRPRHHYSRRGDEHRYYRANFDDYRRSRIKESRRSRDYYAAPPRTGRSRSKTPEPRRTSHAESVSPKHHRKSGQSPKHIERPHHSRRSRSNSLDERREITESRDDRYKKQKTDPRDESVDEDRDDVEVLDKSESQKEHVFDESNLIVGPMSGSPAYEDVDVGDEMTIKETEEMDDRKTVRTYHDEPVSEYFVATVEVDVRDSSNTNHEVENIPDGPNQVSERCDMITADQTERETAACENADTVDRKGSGGGGERSKDARDEKRRSHRHYRKSRSDERKSHRDSEENDYDQSPQPVLETAKYDASDKTATDYARIVNDAYHTDEETRSGGRDARKSDEYMKSRKRRSDHKRESKDSRSDMRDRNDEEYEDSVKDDRGKSPSYGHRRSRADDRELDRKGSNTTTDKKNDKRDHKGRSDDRDEIGDRVGVKSHDDDYAVNAEDHHRHHHRSSRRHHSEKSRSDDRRESYKGD